MWQNCPLQLLPCRKVFKLEWKFFIVCIAAIGLHMITWAAFDIGSSLKLSRAYHQAYVWISGLKVKVGVPDSL